MTNEFIRESSYGYRADEFVEELATVRKILKVALSESRRLQAENDHLRLITARLSVKEIV